MFATQVFLRFLVCRCGRWCGMRGFVLATQAFLRFWVCRCGWWCGLQDGIWMLVGDGGGNVTCLSAWLSEFEPHDVVVHVEAVSDVEVALAEDTEAEVMVEADRRIVAVHVQFDSGFASS